mmetsp:Transcript_23604/g.79305  ORF Transcript_23604/g.79305 Transcript_23604/m.79305 type:complete len:223 (+) Transcript_23604:1827-2495(+)
MADTRGGVRPKAAGPCPAPSSSPPWPPRGRPWRTFRRTGDISGRPISRRRSALALRQDSTWASSSSGGAGGQARGVGECVPGAGNTDVGDKSRAVVERTASWYVSRRRRWTWSPSIICFCSRRRRCRTPRTSTTSAAAAKRGAVSGSAVISARTSYGFTCPSRRQPMGVSELRSSKARASSLPGSLPQKVSAYHVLVHLAGSSPAHSRRQSPSRPLNCASAK